MTAEPALLPSVAPHRLGWRRPVTAGLLALALTSMTAAFARPSIAGEQPRERAVVMVAIDTSTSMLLKDVAPDRITVAKAAAKDFISDLPAGVEVGLVAYNATAELVAAPTSDHDVVAAAVEQSACTFELGVHLQLFGRCEHHSDKVARGAGSRLWSRSGDCFGCREPEHELTNASRCCLVARFVRRCSNGAGLILRACRAKGRHRPNPENGCPAAPI